LFSASRRKVKNVLALDTRSFSGFKLKINSLTGEIPRNLFFIWSRDESYRPSWISSTAASLIKLKLHIFSTV
jgi:hypothetical protein